MPYNVPFHIHISNFTNPVLGVLGGNWYAFFCRASALEDLSLLIPLRIYICGNDAADCYIRFDMLIHSGITRWVALVALETEAFQPPLRNGFHPYHSSQVVVSDCDVTVFGCCCSVSLIGKNRQESSCYRVGLWYGFVKQHAPRSVLSVIGVQVSKRIKHLDQSDGMAQIYVFGKTRCNGRCRFRFEWLL